MGWPIAWTSETMVGAMERGLQSRDRRMGRCWKLWRMKKELHPLSSKAVPSFIIHNEVHCFPTLVVNSTQKIHNSTTLQQWFYMVLCPLHWYTINEVWLLAHKDEVSWFHPTPVSVWSVGDQVNLWKIKESPYRTNESFPLASYCGATFDWSAHSRPNRDARNTRNTPCCLHASALVLFMLNCYGICQPMLSSVVCIAFLHYGAQTTN